MDGYRRLCLIDLFRIEACKVIGSAKLPLRLTWTNPEPLARLYMETHQIIFKNGDGLYSFMLLIVYFLSHHFSLMLSAL